MKRILFTLIFAVLALPLWAQQKNHTHKAPDNPKIEEIVSDLSATQKTRIDVVTRRSSKRIENFRQQLHAVRDSIRALMDSPDDRSEAIFPLYDRESFLQAEISKEYYRSKVAIDEVLTPEQYQTLKKKMKEQREKKERHGDKGPRPDDKPQRPPKR